MYFGLALRILRYALFSDVDMIYMQYCHKAMTEMLPPRHDLIIFLITIKEYLIAI